MQKKQVAVIDVGSSKLTAVVGERGINKTFVIKGRFSYPYDGFENGVFFNPEQLKTTIVSLVEDLKTVFGGKLDTVYVGVPGDFTAVIVRNSQISFSKQKKITEEDIDSLFDGAFVMSSAKHTLINRSAIVYELDDVRRLANPLGISSGLLKGKLSFVVCSNYFIDAVVPVIKNSGVTNVECVSSSLAEALYLIETDTRDRLALMIDIGYISTTLSLVQGDGIIYQRSFSYGGGYITAALAEKFGLDFGVAENLKRKVNLCSVSRGGDCDLISDDNGAYYSVDEVKGTIFNSLDSLCEAILDSVEQSGYVVPDYVSLMITGGGISYLRGAKEHVSSRLGMPVEIIAPAVPMMDNPTDSSLLSLLDLALEQN